MGKNNAKMFDINTFIQAGINPVNKLPYKLNDTQCALQTSVLQSLEIIDEQNAINSFKWYNLPNNLADIIERVLYYKGQGMFFYMETDNTFYFLPYALDGSIDVYGRYLGVTPLPFNGTAQDKKDAWIVGLTKRPVYELIDIQEDDFINGCVLLSDVSKQISQTTLPRSTLQYPVLKAMSEALPLARTNLIANCGVQGFRVNSEDDQHNVQIANATYFDTALTGKPWMPIVSNIEFQDLSNGGAPAPDPFLQYFQALDNFRLSCLGLKNGGIFEKDNEYVNTVTAGNIQANVGQIFQDKLTVRQRFCDLINNIWNLGAYVEPSETVLNQDYDNDGDIDDDYAQGEENNKNQVAGDNV